MQGRKRLILLFKVKAFVNVGFCSGSGFFSKVHVVDFLMLLRSRGKLCGWPERALWEYCISKDDFEENRSLSFSHLTFFFGLCACCVCFFILFFFLSVWAKALCSS